MPEWRDSLMKLPIGVWVFFVVWFVMSILMIARPRLCVFMMRMRLTNDYPTDQEISKVRMYGCVVLVFGCVVLLEALLDP